MILKLPKLEKLNYEMTGFQNTDSDNVPRYSFAACKSLKEISFKNSPEVTAALVLVRAFPLLP
jgi:hypothetical protein